MITIVSRLPEWARKPLRANKAILRRVFYYGSGRFCPVCGNSSRRFASFGAVPRKEALCVHCGALERHRLLWLFIQEKTNLFDGAPKTMLHIAPEVSLMARFRERLGASYLTGDISAGRAMVKMDITDIQYPDESFDVIYCSHVLEHVPDDRRAMRELARVLKKDGWAILLVPMSGEKTMEDPSITDPEERTRLFGQADHVRLYGADYADRLREAGFNVEITEVKDLVGSDEAIRMGLTSGSGNIVYCTK